LFQGPVPVPAPACADPCIAGKPGAVPGRNQEVLVRRKGCRAFARQRVAPYDLVFVLYFTIIKCPRLPYSISAPTCDPWPLTFRAKRSQLGRKFPVDSGQFPAKRARQGMDRAKRTQFATAADIPVVQYSIIPPFPPDAFAPNKPNFGTTQTRANCGSVNELGKKMPALHPEKTKPICRQAVARAEPAPAQDCHPWPCLRRAKLVPAQAGKGRGGGCRWCSRPRRPCYSWAGRPCY